MSIFLALISHVRYKQMVLGIKLIKGGGNMVITKSARKLITVMALIGFLGATTACYGPFNVTKSLHRWNGQIKGNDPVADKWMRELVFLGLVILPVYEFAALGDAIIFNSIEFWTGNNPVKAGSEGNEGRTRVAQVADTTIAVAFEGDGNSASVSYSKEGQIIRTGTILATDEGYQLTDEKGHLLYAAERAIHGGVNLVNENCQLVQHLSEDQLLLGAEKLASVQAVQVVVR